MGEGFVPNWFANARGLPDQRIILLTIAPPVTGGGIMRGQRRHWTSRATCASRSCCRSEAFRICKLHSRAIEVNSPLPAKEREDQSQNDADNDAGNDREIEHGISALDPDIAGQTA